MHHVVNVFLVLGNQPGQVNDQHPVLLAHVADGLVEPGVQIDKLADGNPGIGLKPPHGRQDLGVGVVLVAVELGHEHRRDVPGPADINKRLQIVFEFVGDGGRVDGELFPAHIGEFVILHLHLPAEDLMTQKADGGMEIGNIHIPGQGGQRLEAREIFIEIKIDDGLPAGIVPPIGLVVNQGHQVIDVVHHDHHIGVQRDNFVQQHIEGMQRVIATNPGVDGHNLLAGLLLQKLAHQVGVALVFVHVDAGHRGTAQEKQLEVRLGVVIIREHEAVGVGSDPVGLLHQAV